MRPRKSKAGSLTVEYWVVYVPGTFNGIDRLHFSGSRQLSATQPMSSPASASGEKQAAQEGDSSASLELSTSLHELPSRPGLLSQICDLTKLG